MNQGVGHLRIASRSTDCGSSSAMRVMRVTLHLIICNTPPSRRRGIDFVITIAACSSACERSMLTYLLCNPMPFTSSDYGKYISRMSIHFSKLHILQAYKGLLSKLPAIQPTSAASWKRFCSASIAYLLLVLHPRSVKICSVPQNKTFLQDSGLDVSKLSRNVNF